MRSQQRVEHATGLSARQIETRANYGIIPRRMQQHSKGQRGSTTRVHDDTVERLQLLERCLERNRRSLHAEACELFTRFYALPKPERVREVVGDYLDGLSLLAFGPRRAIPAHLEAYHARESIRRRTDRLVSDPAASLLGSPEVLSEIVSMLLRELAGASLPHTLESRAAWTPLGTLKYAVRDASPSQLYQAASNAREKLQRDEAKISRFVSTQVGDSKVIIPMLMFGHVCRVPHTILQALLPLVTALELLPPRTAEEHSRLDAALPYEVGHLAIVHSALEGGPTAT